MDKDAIRIEYMPLDKLQRWPRNPKAHDLGALHVSINRFGFVAPITIDERTGKIVAGHGRLDALQQMKAGGKDAPAGIEVRDGEWYAPVVRGIRFNSDSEVEAYLVADNRLSELGGWEDEALAALLSDLAAEDAALLQATGYDADDLDALLRMMAAPSLDELADEYGDHDGAEFYPVIRLQVEPETFELYESLMLNAPGDDDAEKFAALMAAVDVSALGAGPS